MMPYSDEVLRQMSVLSDRLSDIAGDIKAHRERSAAVADQVVRMENNLEKMETKLEKMDHQISNIDDMANKYKGGIFVVMGLGAAAGTILTFWDRIAAWLHH